MPYCPVLATLGYVVSPDRERVLLVCRNKRNDDLHYGKYNGLGGKLESNEDVIAGLRREIREEAGIEIRDVNLRGTISWPGFGKNGEDWFGFIFRIDSFDGEPWKENAEGLLEWIPIKDLHNMNLWESDREWLDMVFENGTPPFHGIAPFQNGRATSWQCSRAL